MAYHARVRTDSGYRKLQAIMDETEGMRITAMTRDVAPGLRSGCRSAGPKQFRVPQVSQNHKLCLAHEPRLHRHPYTDVHSISTHTQRRPSNTAPAATVCDEYS